MYLSIYLSIITRKSNYYVFLTVTAAVLANGGFLMVDINMNSTSF
jgi:hypothetical protein